MDVKLIVVGGKHAGRAIPIAGPKFVIGRAPDCQLRPGSDLVSRHHCQLDVEPGRVVLRDLNSRNGTLVNDQPIREPYVVRNGDRIKIGPLEFQVELTVSVGGKKKPKVQSVSEAAARTVQSAARATDEDFDIEKLLGDDDSSAGGPTGAAAPVSPDTVRTRLSDTATIVLPPQPPAKTPPGRVDPAQQQLGATSRDAAAEVLRRYLTGRR